MPRPNWSRALPVLLGHLPKETRARDTWPHVEAVLKKAAAGGDTTQASIDGVDVGKRREAAEVRPAAD